MRDDLPWYEYGNMLDAAEKRARLAFNAYVKAARYGSAAEYAKAKAGWEGAHRHAAEVADRLNSKRN